HAVFGRQLHRQGRRQRQAVVGDELHGQRGRRRGSSRPDVLTGERARPGRSPGFSRGSAGCARSSLDASPDQDAQRCLFRGAQGLWKRRKEALDEDEGPEPV
ncbi:hypothetical protein B8W95_12970, partial [Staphylococcus pasteuri]